MAKAKKKSSAASTVSTSHLITEIAAKFDSIPKKMTKEVITSFLEAIENGVASGSKVRIDKLGILAVKDRAARKGRNPQTGEEIKIPAGKKVAFRVASSLKERVGIKKKATTKAPAKKKK